MKIAVRHELRIPIAPGSARAAVHLLLTAQGGPSQSVKDWRVEAEGLDGAAFFDAFGNRAQLLTQTKPGEAITVTVQGTAETRDTNGVVGRLPRDPVAALFRRITPLTEPDAALVAELEPLSDNRIGLLHALMARVVEPGQTQMQTQGGQSQEQGAPSLEGAVHAFIGAARGLGIPARYVTGYLVGDEDDPSAFHAWAEAFDERLGWIGFDPKLQLCPTERHVHLACGLDAMSAAAARAVPAAAPETVSLEVLA